MHIGKNHTFLKPDKSLPTGVWPAAVLCAILVFNLLFAGPWVFAQEGDAAKKLRDQDEFSVVNTSGNTDVSTLSLKNALEYDFHPHLMGTWNLSALYGEQDFEDTDNYKIVSVAAIGLMTDNVAAIIGAMVIAPFLGPNVALALSTCLADYELVNNGLKTLLAGAAMAFALSVAIGMLFDIDPSSGEIASRTQASMSDIVTVCLLIAVILLWKVE